MRMPLLTMLFSMAAATAVAQSPSGKVDYSRLNPSDPVFEDLYVQLYLARVEQRKLEIEMLKQDLEVELADRERMELLYARNVVPAAEVEASRRDAEIAALNIRQSTARLKEAEALLNIAIDRTSVGLKMPICATLQ